jgi:hypothetical protein
MKNKKDLINDIFFFASIFLSIVGVSLLVYGMYLRSDLIMGISVPFMFSPFFILDFMD